MQVFFATNINFNISFQIMDELKNNIHDDEIDLIAIIIEILRHRLKIILSVFIFSLIGILL